MCHRRTDWSRITSKASEPEEEWEIEDEPESEDDREFEDERTVEDDREEDPLPADD